MEVATYGHNEINTFRQFTILCSNIAFLQRNLSGRRINVFLNYQDLRDIKIFILMDNNLFFSSLDMWRMIDGKLLLNVPSRTFPSRLHDPKVVGVRQFSERSGQTN